MALAAPSQYVRPKIVTDSSCGIELVSARHPVMEFQEGMSFISNDYSMSRAVSAFHIITGPNMGGKSTYIRQVPDCEVTLVHRPRLASC